MKMSAGVLALALLIGTAYGPLEQLNALPEGALTDGTYWRHFLEEAIRSGAGQAKAIVAVVAASFGLPLISRTAKNAVS